MKIGVIPNAERDNAHAYTREVCAFLQSRGYQPLLQPAAAWAAEMPEAAALEDTFYRESIFVVVLGGDGTMLEVSHHAAPYGAALLGINLGNLGYLTDADRHEGLKSIENVLNNNYKREQRMMLSIENASTKRFAAADRLALNDVCLSRGTSGKLVSFQLFINGDFMDTIRADGIIVATPTGSTAYNLSAGGPILAPDGDFAVITPVCPHMFHARPWVIKARDKIEIRVADDTLCRVNVSMDGAARLTLQKGESVSISRAGFDTYILRTSGMGFFEILRKKLMG